MCVYLCLLVCLRGLEFFPETFAQLFSILQPKTQVQQVSLFRLKQKHLFKNAMPAHPPASKASREEANLNERKNLHTPKNVTSFSVFNTEAYIIYTVF